ncbi:MAG: ribbon-helix-helix domain-containing protein [Spirochaetes bacterium]|nr:ribbon-helix-helix domain-containing protein [Spirochaetota bacterium]
MKSHTTSIEISNILLEEIDEMIKEGYFISREEAVNEACDRMIKEYKLAKLKDKDSRKQNY